MVKDTKLSRFIAKGFDKARHLGFGKYRVDCSYCAVVVINGIPCHETGCRNSKHECKGCDKLIPMRQKYCEDCM